jgi:hypothetical protein
MDNQNQASPEFDFRNFENSLKAEIDEIMKYKWYLGESLKRDPLEVQSIDDISKDWINKHAHDFRVSWEQKKYKIQPQ